MWFSTKPAPRADHAERIERLERQVRDLQADWDATYDKFAMLLKRWAKREKALVEDTNGGHRGVRNMVTMHRGD